MDYALNNPLVLELARSITSGHRRGVRRVRTPEGSRKYGLPIGAIITRDAELRAKSKFPSLKVPEDRDPRVSSKDVTARPKADYKQLAEKLKNDPEFKPQITSPKGNKTVKVGDAEFHFPDGSKIYRFTKDQRFAVVRDPKYDLIGVTDQGVAFDIRGDSEKTLNERLDNLDPNDPEIVSEDIGTPRPDSGSGSSDTGAGAPDKSTPAEPDYTQYAAPEDVPEYLGDDYIKKTVKALVDGGVDPKLAKAVEDQLHKQNDEIRRKWEDANDPNAKEIHDIEAQLAELQARLEDLKKPNGKKEKAPSPDAPKEKAPSPDAPKEKAPSPDAPKEKSSPNGELARLQVDAIFKDLGVDSNPEDFANVDAHKQRLAQEWEKRFNENPDLAAAARRDLMKTPDKNPETDKQLADLENKSRKTPIGTAAGEVNGHPVVVRRNRKTDQIEYAVGDQPAAKRDEVLIKVSENKNGQISQDTSSMSPDEMSPQQLDAVIADFQDGIREFGQISPEGQKRLDSLVAARKRSRRAGRKEGAPRHDLTEQTPVEPVSTITTDTFRGRRVDDSALAKLDAVPGKGSFARSVADRNEILNSRTGDKFIVSTKDGTHSLWGLEDDGKFHRLSGEGDTAVSPADFADLLDENPFFGHADIYAFSGNESNKSDHPQLNPGDRVSQAWVDESSPGSVAQGSNGLLGQKNEEGTYDSAIGTVSKDFFGPSDVENDDTFVVRNGPDPDGKPAGAADQVSSPEDLKDVRVGDAVVLGGGELTLERKSDGEFEADLGGLKFPMTRGEVEHLTLEGSLGAWHVPNQDYPNSKKNPPAPGDTVRSLEDIHNLEPGSRISVTREDGRTTNFSVLGDDLVIDHVTNAVVPNTVLRDAASSGRITVSKVASKGDPVPEIPKKQINGVGDYVTGDAVVDYKHLRDMKPGQKVTIHVKSSKNGGKSLPVVLTRTDDTKDNAGFMFLVGKRGAGYNSFGENNASIFQAIADGRLYFGDITEMSGSAKAEILDTNWDNTPNIDLWEGGPKVSQKDLWDFINAQVYSRAMQTSYYNVDLLPADSPFRAKHIRDKMSIDALNKYHVMGADGKILIPARAKPAMIRYAAEKLGLEYTDPGAALIPDDLELADFKKKVAIGKYVNGVSPNAERDRMGPEMLEVTVADLKVARAIVANMLTSNQEAAAARALGLDPKDSTPDKILKRVMAMRGSPLQDMNIALGVAAYFNMKRDRDGIRQGNITAARQHDKTRNKKLLLQMMQEQLEGRPPGYYGIPEDEVWRRTDKDGNPIGPEFRNHSVLRRPALNSDNDPDANTGWAATAVSSTPPPQTAGDGKFLTPRELTDLKTWERDLLGWNDTPVNLPGQEPDAPQVTPLETPDAVLGLPDNSRVKITTVDGKEFDGNLQADGTFSVKDDPAQSWKLTPRGVQASIARGDSYQQLSGGREDNPVGDTAPQSANPPINASEALNLTPGARLNFFNGADRNYELVVRDNGFEVVRGVRGRARPGQRPIIWSKKDVQDMLDSRPGAELRRMDSPNSPQAPDLIVPGDGANPAPDPVAAAGGGGSSGGPSGPGPGSKLNPEDVKNLPHFAQLVFDGPGGEHYDLRVIQYADGHKVLRGRAAARGRFNLNWVTEQEINDLFARGEVRRVPDLPNPPAAPTQVAPPAVPDVPGPGEVGLDEVMAARVGEEFQVDMPTGLDPVRLVVGPDGGLYDSDGDRAARRDAAEMGAFLKENKLQKVAPEDYQYGGPIMTSDEIAALPEGVELTYVTRRGDKYKIRTLADSFEVTTVQGRKLSWVRNKPTVDLLVKDGEFRRPVKQQAPSFEKSPQPSAPAPALDSPEAKAWQAFNVGDVVGPKDLASAPEGTVISYRRKDGRSTQYFRSANGWKSMIGKKDVAIEGWGRARFSVVHVPTGQDWKHTAPNAPAAPNTPAASAAPNTPAAPAAPDMNLSHVPVSPPDPSKWGRVVASDLQAGDVVHRREVLGTSVPTALGHGYTAREDQLRVVQSHGRLVLEDADGKRYSMEMLLSRSFEFQHAPASPSKRGGVLVEPDIQVPAIPDILKNVKQGQRLKAAELRALPEGASVFHGYTRYYRRGEYLETSYGQKYKLEEVVRRKWEFGAFATKQDLLDRLRHEEDINGRQAGQGVILKHQNIDMKKREIARQAAEAARLAQEEEARKKAAEKYKALYDPSQSLETRVSKATDALSKLRRERMFDPTPDAADKSPEAFKAQFEHFDKGGNVFDAPRAGLWNFMMVRGDLFDIKRLTEKNGALSDIYLVTDNRDGSRLVTKIQPSAMQGIDENALFNEVGALELVRAAGIDGAVRIAAGFGNGDKAQIGDAIIMENYEDVVGLPGAGVNPLRLKGSIGQQIKDGPDPDALVRLGLVDYLIGNERDRHANNVIGVPTGNGGARLALLDFGLAFGNGGGFEATADFATFLRRSRMGGWDYTGQVKLVHGDSRALKEAVQRELTKLLGLDIEGLRERLRDVGMSERQIDMKLSFVEARMANMRETGFVDSVVNAIYSPARGGGFFW